MENGDGRDRGQDYRVPSAASAEDGEVTVITSWRGEEGERSSNTRLDVRWPGKFPGAKRDRGVGSIYEVER